MKSISIRTDRRTEMIDITGRIQAEVQ